MRVLVACEFSGIVRDAFKAKGHDAWSCDLLPTERRGNHLQQNILTVSGIRKSTLDLDILDQRPEWKWDLMIAFPPCTYLTVTGNKWFKPEYKSRFPNRLQQREEAVEFFMSLANASIRKICIENPVGIMSTRWRKPNQIIQPFQFGHPQPKKTCLWLKNLPLLQSTKIVEPEYYISKSGKKLATWYFKTTAKLPSKERTKMRSRTFQGIADAMAEQWG